MLALFHHQFGPHISGWAVTIFIRAPSITHQSHELAKKRNKDLRRDEELYGTMLEKQCTR